MINLLLFSSALLIACASVATSGSSSSSSPVNLAVTTKPNPPAVGDNELILTVTDQNGNPIQGASVDISADHTDMTGMTMSGLATDQGGGNYAINANFSMSGNWKLTVYVRKDALDYKQDLEFKVQ